MSEEMVATLIQSVDLKVKSATKGLVLDTSLSSATEATEFLTLVRIKYPRNVFTLKQLNNHYCVVMADPASEI
ncbi:hypothetical protein [Levilactobacillus bambusae]|uniref:Uncharacterized protein n=1 Tax=Levilactobacillus bambusae TaxID=2024736 RepID=A0A2V1N3P0_9LACO|nr:hypothetical protein [Levilactobacillus bambusae]PWG00705.1 hypothetical protein DCM90_00585 [Levilactobacillus bambusae]